MDDLNQMLDSILSDPKSMEQLKAAARALGLDPDGPPPAGGQSAPVAPAAGQAPAPDLSALAALLGGTQRQSQPQQPTLDPNALLLIQSVITRLNQPDKNIELLRALKPHFSAGRATRVDSAIRMMQLFSLLPVLRESGLLGDLRGLEGLGRLLGGGRR